MGSFLTMDRDLQESTTNLHTVNRRTLVLASSLALLAGGIAGVDANADAPAGTPAPIGTPIAPRVPEWLTTVEDLVRIETWRASDDSNEAEVVEHIGQIKARLAQDIDAFVASNRLAKAAPIAFEWRDAEK